MTIFGDDGTLQTFTTQRRQAATDESKRMLRGLQMESAMRFFIDR